ncbi:zinc finger protein 184-like [Salvelinus fontinalis]|uniref:zinc finger protein 184-like n=1 Tax=Salvelinus fontinalis TaxID=8038 RepID=UPI0024861462|nr:zinc finger protein 184-like [Salvelinus fontinalis]
MQGFMNILSSASSVNESEVNRHFHQHQTDSRLKIQRNPHSSQQKVQESYSLSTSCLFLQPTVLLHRLDIADMPLPVSSPTLSPTLRIKSVPQYSLTPDPSYTMGNSNRSKRVKMCSLCGKTFIEAEDLMAHMRSHTEQNPYQSFEELNMSTSSFEDGIEISQPHGTSPLSPTTFKVCPTPRQSSKSRPSSKSRTCHVCLKTFYAVYSMRKHMIFKRDQLIYQCLDCGEQFERKFNLREHTAECHPTLSSKARTCHLCNKTFGSPYLMRKHLKSQHDQLPYQCRDCGEHFKRKCNLKEHTKNCPTMFSCLSCGEKFEERCNLKEHKKECLAVKELFSCSLCKKPFIEARGLTAHMRSHEKKSNLKEPKVCLAAKKRHFCSMCNKTFIKVHDLKAHWRSYTYQCTQCLQSFEHQENLQKHPQYAREEATQLEEVNTFTPSFEEEMETSQPHNTSNVRRDQRYSFRARTCSLCHKTFNSIALMRTHLNSKHAQLPYQCFCGGENFKKKINLKAHRKERHPTPSLQPKESVKARSCRLCRNTFDSTVFYEKAPQIATWPAPLPVSGLWRKFHKDLSFEGA